MRNLKMKKIFAFGMVLVAISFATMSSCSKDDEVSADYVGTWLSDESIASSSEKETLILTANSLTINLQTKDETTGSWVEYYGLKGSISVNKQLLTITITEIGVAFDVQTGEPTGTMTFYKAGSASFDLLLQHAEQSVTFNSEYSVSGNTLTLKTDDNNDGDYMDEGESTTFTKQ